VERTSNSKRWVRVFVCALGFLVICVPIWSDSGRSAASESSVGRTTYGEMLTPEEWARIRIIVMDSPPTPPEGVHRESVRVLSMDDVILEEVPTSRWTYGCSATSAGMIFGYYDRTGYPDMYTGPTNEGVAPLWNLGQGIGKPIAGSCSIIATERGFDGRRSNGHVDDYWIGYLMAGPDPWESYGYEHAWGECTADFMGTNQWKWDLVPFPEGDGEVDFNVDGATVLVTYDSNDKLYDFVPPESAGMPATALCHGMRLFAESRGYSVRENYTQMIDTQYTGGFSFDDYKSEIDSGYPVMIQLAGHSVVGVGYGSSVTGTVYLHDTWDNSVHSMSWGGSYAGMEHLAVTIIHLEPSIHFVTPVRIEVSGPEWVDEDSGAQYMCTADYEDGSTMDITGKARWAEDSFYASMDSSGYLTAKSVPSDQLCNVIATYKGLSDSVAVTIVDRVRYIEISGPTLVEDDTGAQYTCIAHHDDGSEEDVTAEASWDEDSPYADMCNNGYLNTDEVSSDQLVRITAQYRGESDIQFVTIKGSGPVLYVDDDGASDPGPGDATVSDANEDGSIEHPYDSIQEAIDAAEDGYTIIVREGIYSGRGNRDIEFSGKGVAVRTIGGPGTAEIECGGTKSNHHRGFYFHSYDTNSVVDGLTIRHGYAQMGGGIYGEPGNTVTVMNCVIEKCKAGLNGGGVAGCDGAIMNCVVKGNWAGGAGSGLYECDGIVSDCRIAGNEADGEGYGVYNCGAKIVDSKIVGNSGGGLRLCDGGISGCVVGDNGGNGLNSCGGVIEDCVITGNAGGLYDCDGAIRGCAVSGNFTEQSGGGLYDCDGPITDCIISGNEAGNDGGGLSRCDGAIEGCIVSGNFAGDIGGGLDRCGGAITNCSITGNTSVGGGGGMRGSDGPIISNCTISNNESDGNGGGLMSCEASVISNCIITGNEGLFGGGFYDCGGDVTNCTITENKARLWGGGLYQCYGSIYSSIIWNNVALDHQQLYETRVPHFSSIEGWRSGGSNVKADPLFADAANGDYHLKSEAGRWDPEKGEWVKDEVTSPCIDGGHPGIDWRFGELWPNGYRINMGAYGGTAEASMSLSDSGIGGDLNFDFVVNFVDFAIMAREWQTKKTLLAEDLDRDGVVDVNDIVVLGENWLESEEPNFPASIEEGFESGDFEQLDWQHGGQSHWRVIPTGAHSGDYAARSGSILDNQESVLAVRLEPEFEINHIRFWYRVSSEEGYDYLLFYIDGVQEGQWSGECDWTEQSYPLEMGEHDFKWVYKKDFSGDEGLDSAWIDDIGLYYDPRK